MLVYNRKTKEKEDVNLFGECEKTLKYLSDSGIFEIIYAEIDNDFGIAEMNGKYYAKTLTVEMCKDLSELFGKIAKHIESK